MTGLWLKGMENRIPLCQRELRRPWHPTKCRHSHCTLITAHNVCVVHMARVHAKDRVPVPSGKYYVRWRNWGQNPARLDQLRRREGRKEELHSRAHSKQPFCTPRSERSPQWWCLVSNSKGWGRQVVRLPPFHSGVSVQPLTYQFSPIRPPYLAPARCLLDYTGFAEFKIKPLSLW